MLFVRLIYFISIVMCLLITIYPLKIMNAIRVMVNLREVDEEDVRVDFYRIRGIVGVMFFSLLLFISFFN